MTGALSIGSMRLALGSARVPGQWWDADAILDADFKNGRFRWDGKSYASETAFLTDIGGTKSGSQRTIGPYVDPASPELILNGDFAGGTLADWTTQLNGSSSISIVSGYAQFVSDGSAGTGLGGAGMTQGVATVLDRAYRILFRNPTATGTLASRIGSGTPTGVGAIARNASPGESIVATWSAAFNPSYFYPYRNAVGTTGIDDISIKECLPFKGFVQGGFTARVQGVTPAAASGTKVAVAFSQIHNSEPATRVDFRYNASGELHVLASYLGSTIADLNLGAVPVSTAFDVWFTATANDYRAVLNGGTVVSDTSGGISGFGALYVGRDLTGNNWDGGELRVQVYAGGGVERLYTLIDRAIHFDGDSFAGGAYGVVLPTTLATLIGRPVYNTGVGGSTMDQISARLVAAAAGIHALPTVVWDGDQNGLTTVSAYCDLLAAGIAALGHSKFIVIPPCTNYGQSDVSQEIAIRNEMMVRWPGNTLDWRDVLPMTAGYPTQAMFYDTGSDTTHLGQAAMDLMAAAIKAFIAGKGW